MRDLPAPGLRHASLAQSEGDVVGDGEPGKERVGLEHHAAIGARAGDGLAVEQHAARGGAVEAGNDAQQRRLAAAGGAEDGDEIVVGDAERDRLQRAGRLGAAPGRGKRAGDALDCELAHRRLHGKSQRLAALNRKSEINPMMPMTMMPKMI